MANFKKIFFKLSKTKNNKQKFATEEQLFKLCEKCIKKINHAKILKIIIKRVSIVKF